MEENNVDTKERNFLATVLFVVESGKVLLGIKREKIGKGLYNGPGGEVELWDPSVRWRLTLEQWQETGLICDDDDPEEVGRGYFRNIKEDGSVFEVEVCFFRVEKIKCSGSLRNTSEMYRFEWFDFDVLPSEMIVADKYFVPQMLKGKKLKVWATMKNHQSELVGDVKIDYVDCF